MRAVVVLNPVSGGAVDRESVGKALAEVGLAADIVDTTEEDPGIGMAKAAVRNGADVVVAAGGDGTVRACLEGVVGTDTALGVIPAGTGNLLARNLDFADADPAAALALITSGARRTMDVGRANGEAFAVMAGSGFDALMIRDADAGTKDKIGAGAYVISGLRHLRRDLVRTRVIVDGEVVLDSRTAMVLVGNCGRLQAGVQVFPDAAVDDGLLDVAVVGAGTTRDWIRVGLAFLMRRSAPDRLVRRFRGADVVVRTQHPRAWELDGEDRPATQELRCRVEPASLTVCTPRQEDS